MTGGTGISNGFVRPNNHVSSTKSDQSVPTKDKRNDGEKRAYGIWTTFRNATVPTFAFSAAPSLGSCLRLSFGVTLALYILNQKHLLPRPLSSIVSKALFWPTLPITVVKRLGNWFTTIDETVIMGGAPFGFAKLPEKLHEQYGVVGVINLCEEYRGPDRAYKHLGIRHLHLPTTDHFEPSLVDLKTAVHFIAEHKALGKKVYVHCRAGHGRSAAVVFAWLLTKNPNVHLEQLNRELCLLRNVRRTLYKQPNILRFHSHLQKGNAGSYGDDSKNRILNDTGDDEL